MSSPTRVCVLHPDNSQMLPYFSAFGEAHSDFKEFLRDAENHRLLVFSGGTDIHPRIYGEQYPEAFSKPTPTQVSERDLKEVFAFQVARAMGIPMAGICRGMQFLAAMCGGRLVQDITRHGYCRTAIRTFDGQEFEGACDHHQMALFPKNSLATVIAEARPAKSKHYQVGSHTSLPETVVEVEAFWNNDPLIIASQYHPEWMDSSEPGYQWFAKMVEALLGVAEKSNSKEHISQPAARLSAG